MNLFKGEVRGFFGGYRWLSNFWITPVHYEGQIYPSSENAYQAAKCKHESDREQFVICAPGKAKRLGRKIEIRDDWDAVKHDTMSLILISKFNNNPELKRKLIGLYDYYIEETNNWGDTYWGVCNGVGENKLGLLMMTMATFYNGISDNPQRGVAT